MNQALLVAFYRDYYTHNGSLARTLLPTLRINRTSVLGRDIVRTIHALRTPTYSSGRISKSEQPANGTYDTPPPVRQFFISGELGVEPLRGTHCECNGCGITLAPDSRIMARERAILIDDDH